MNKKFSTLVAALLVSGGLAYAVDAMILPANEGAANYVTAVAATSDKGEFTGYKLETVTFNAETSCVWKMVKVGQTDTYNLTATSEDQAAYYLAEKEGTLALQASAEGALAFTLNADGTLTVNDETLLIADGVLSLGTASADVVSAGLFGSNKKNVATANISDKLALGGIVMTVPELADLTATSNVLNWKADDGSLSLATLTSTTAASWVTAEKWSIADGKIKAADSKILTVAVADAAPTLGADGTAISLESDGAVKLGEMWLKISGSNITCSTAEPTAVEKVYLYSAVDAIVSSTADASGLVISTKTMTEATVANLAEDAKVISVEAQYLVSTPGAEIPGMEGIEVSDKGVVTVDASTKAIPAPQTIALDGMTLSLNAKGELVLATISETSKETPVSLTLTNGKYESVSLKKAGVAKRFLQYAEASQASLSTKVGSFGPTGTFTYVEEGKATTFSFTAGGVLRAGNTELGATTITLTGEAPAAKALASGEAAMTSVPAGYVALGGDGVLFGNSNKTATTLFKVKETQAVAGGVYRYSFTDMTGAVLSVNDNGTDYNEFESIKKYDGSFTLKAKNGKFVKLAANGTDLSLVNDNATVFGLYNAGTINYSATILNAVEGKGFSLTVKDNTGENSNLQGNVFTGKLTAMELVDGAFEPATGETFALKSGNSYIVLDTKAKWSANGSTDLPSDSYKFTTISEAVLLKDIAKGANAQYNYEFSIATSASNATYDKTDDELVLADVKGGVAYISVVGTDYKIATYNSDKKDYLTVSTNLKNYAVITFGGGNLVKGADLLIGYATVKVANTGKYDTSYKGKVLGVTQKENGNVTYVEFLDPQNVDITKPEGQWAITLVDGENATDESSIYKFTNRESGAFTSFVLYKTGVADVYAVSSGLELIGADTLRIEKVTLNGGLQMDGYFNEKQEVTRDNVYTISVASAVEGVDDIYLAENHKNKHLVGLTGVKENATEWLLKPQTGARSETEDGITISSDSVYVFNKVLLKNAKGEYKFRQDTLAMIPYMVINSSNNEGIVKSEDEQSYKCDEAADGIGNRFVIKEKNGKYNLVSPKYTSSDAYEWNVLDNKLYGAITTADGRIKDANTYQYIANDMFNVKAIASPEYRKTVSNLDTISIYRQENDHQYLYEKGEFLNIDNVSQFGKMNPSLFADTAYVNREGNNRWQYLLAVNAEQKLRNDDCGVPSHEKYHTDTVYGRFLVNLIDSAVVTNERKVHTNKYINKGEAGETLAKLGFVYGFHTNDSLYITKGMKGAVTDTLYLGNKDFNQAKFAFRYTDSQDTKAFKIQTRYIDYDTAIGTDEFTEETNHNNGYLKWINGTVVVVDGWAQGDEFNMNADENRIPTTNEGVSASEVSIIAGNGSVVVKGAAGKSVAISNILGQTIVNTVLTSDNATISVPAGIVVVAVEGEEAVKTVVK